MENGKKGNAQGDIEPSYLGMGDEMNNLTKPAVLSAIDHLQLRKGSSGLDAGCGLGNHTLWLAEAVSPNGHVTGVDISEEGLARAKRKLESSDLMEQVTFKRGDIFDLPFEDGTFDWVWSADTLYLWLMGTLESQKIPQDIMRELARVTKSGGTIALLFWSSQKLLPGYPLLEAKLNATKAANFTGPFGIQPILHSSRTLGWFQLANLMEPRVRNLVVEFQAPLSEEEKKALMGTFGMFWNDARSEVSEEVWTEYIRLCSWESPEFILNLPDYHGYIVYSLFSAMVD